MDYCLLIFFYFGDNYAVCVCVCVYTSVSVFVVVLIGLLLGFSEQS